MGNVETKNTCDFENNIWMIKPCEEYLEEYNNCTSWKSKQYQKYLYGEIQEATCSQWKTDYNLCLNYRNFKAILAAKTLIEHEKSKRNLRLNSIKSNDVWKYRTVPPPDWLKDLPKNLTDTCIQNTSSENKKNE